MAIGKVITDDGKNLALKLLFGDSSVSALEKIRVGVGDTTPLIGNSDINKSVPLTPSTIDECDGVGTWTEGGQGKAVSTDTDIYKEGYGTSDNTALNITKDGVGGVAAYWDFDYGSNIDMTDEDLLLWVYIVDATALAKLTTSSAFIIYASTAGLGTDYKAWYFDRSELSVGWNLLKIDVSSTADATSGTTNISTIRYFRVYYKTNNNADTTSDGDILMDFWHNATRDTDYNIDFISGYPTYDTSLQKATLRGLISSNEATGYNIVEYGVYNTDTTPVLFSHDVSNPVSKSSTEEISITITYRCKDDG